MEKHLFQTVPASERAQMLRDNCDKIEEQTYMKQFTHEEISLMKDSLADVSIELNDIALEKKEVTAEYTEREKPLKKETKGLLLNIKRKAIEVHEECFKFIDQDNGEVAFYNQVGDLIFSRPIQPSEKQKTIFALPKTGTNK